MPEMEKENKKSRSSLQSLHLPQELVEEEILSRLPVKSLLRFRCVSKQWASLIGSKRFIKKHLHNYGKNQPPRDRWRMILCCKTHGLNKLRRSNSKEPFVDPKINHLMEDNICVDYCDGVLCMYNKAGYFFLWNPATRISAELPMPDLRNLPKLDLQNLKITKWGFGWDEQSSAHKVFVVISDDDERIGQVYSSKTNSWKGVSPGNHPWLGMGVFACGKIHWVVENGGRSYIEAFDLESEAFGEIELPCNRKGGVKIHLGRHIDGWLSLMYDGNGTQKFWIMKQYGVKVSWVEHISAPSKGKGKSKSNIIIARIGKHCCKRIQYLESLVSPLLE